MALYNIKATQAKSLGRQIIENQEMKKKERCSQ